MFSGDQSIYPNLQGKDLAMTLCLSLLWTSSSHQFPD